MIQLKKKHTQLVGAPVINAGFPVHPRWHWFYIVLTASICQVTKQEKSQLASTT